MDLRHGPEGDNPSINSLEVKGGEHGDHGDHDGLHRRSSRLVERVCVREDDATACAVRRWFLYTRSVMKVVPRLSDVRFDKLSVDPRKIVPLEHLVRDPKDGWAAGVR